MLPVTSSGAQYYEKYGFLKRMSSKGGLTHVFGNGTGTHKVPLVSQTSRELLTGMYSRDPDVMLFQRELSHELNKIAQPALDKNGFTKNGIHSTFDRLRTVAGYMPSAMSYTPLNNDFYRKELNLSPGYSSVQQKIADNVWHIMFNTYQPSHVKVPKKSTSGPRRNTSDADWKRDFALFLYESPRLESMLQCVDVDDWETLANELEMLFMMYIQKRDQVDMPGKERIVFDLEYALSNGRKGRAFATDKSVSIDGRDWADFSATRARVIHAGPWVINCVLQIISSGHMQAMFERFPKVFHVSTASDIKSIIDGNYIECGDVKEFDRSMSKDAIDTPIRIGKEYWDPRLMKMSALLYYSPYYSRPLAQGEESVFVGDPREMGEQVICGNRSGHAWTSFVAKVNKCIDTLCVFHAMGLDVVGHELNYFESKGAINFINNGDDEIVYTSSVELWKKYKEYRYNGNHGHYVVESEVGQGYSGLLMIVSDESQLSYTPVPKVHTAMEKIYTPERSIGGNFRANWPIGILERVNNQHLAPMGPAVWEVHNRLFHDRLAPRFGSFLSIVNQAMERLKDITFDALTAADKDVLDDNDRIHYKYVEADISPEIYAKVTSKIPFELYQHVVKTYYTGHIL